MKSHRIFACGLIACAFTALTWAQEEAAPEAQWDATSKKLLKDWEGKWYHLGRAGVEKASCKIEVNVQGPMTGAMSTTGAYRWDGESSTMTWDNAQLGAMVSGQGFGQENLDSNFKSDQFGDVLGKCTLTAESTDTGTRIKVEGENRGGFTAILFDAQGVMTRIEAAVDPGMGQKMPMTISFEYGEVDGKNYSKGWTVEMDIPQMGKMVDKTEITVEQVGDFWAMTKQHSTSNMGGQQMGTRTITISDWKFNDDVE